MRVLVIGATGVLGQAVTRRLRGSGHTVQGLGRHSDPAVDLTQPSRVLETLTGMEFAAVVCTAANTPLLPLAELDPESLTRAITGKLLGQLAVLTAALQHCPPPRSVTLTSGAFDAPTNLMAAGALVNAGLEQFVRHAAHEIGSTGLRLNIVRPGWVRESVDPLSPDPAATPVDIVAQTYLGAVEGTVHGEVLIPAGSVGGS